jgi:chromate transporter
MPVIEVFVAFLKLGLTSFGGPIAHLGYFRQEFVQRREWLSEQAYADIVALCQFLPGPASSQVGIALGILRAGLPGGIAAWIGFTLPSALLMIGLAYGLQLAQLSAASGWIHGLKIAAVAVVAQAVWGMGRQLCPDRVRASIAILAALTVLAWSGVVSQIVVIVAGAVLGWRILKPQAPAALLHFNLGVGRRTSWLAWVFFFGLLAALPWLAWHYDSHAVSLFDRFYRTGALVFGGGHVVLPLLQAEVVAPSWIRQDVFLAGYGFAQALPGPLFTFAAYLGAVMGPSPNGWSGGLLALVAIFLPSFLLVVGALPLWDSLRRKLAMRAALDGVNATVVGLLLAALYNPIFTSAVRSPAEFALALAAFALLALWKLPPIGIVVFSAIGGALIAAF